MMGPASRVQAFEQGMIMMATLDVLGEKLTIMARPADGRAGATVIEDVTPPGGGPPLHVHHHTDEIFYVVEGTMRMWRGDETFEAGPGTLVLLPKSVPHTFQNIGTVPSRMVVTILPGGFERFFEEVSARGLAAPKDLPALQELAREYAVEILGPPPGAS